MSDRALKRAAVWCGALAALCGILALFAGWVGGFIDSVRSVAYGVDVPAAGRYAGMFTGPLQTFAVICALLALTAIAGLVAALAVLNHRKRRGS